MLCQASCCSLGNGTLFLRSWRSHHVRLRLMKSFVFRNWGRLCRSWKLRRKIWKQLWATAKRNYKLWNWKTRYKQLINSIHWHFSNFRRKSSALLRFWLQNKLSLKELRWRLIYFFNCPINCKFTLSNHFAIPLSHLISTSSYYIGAIFGRSGTQKLIALCSRVFLGDQYFIILRVTFEENFKNVNQT